MIFKRFRRYLAAGQVVLAIVLAMAWTLAWLPVEAATKKSNHGFDVLKCRARGTAYCLTYAWRQSSSNRSGSGYAR
jgi:hypothetical protein